MALYFLMNRFLFLFKFTSLEMLSGSATNVKEQELYLYIVPAAYKYLKQNNLRWFHRDRRNI